MHYKWFPVPVVLFEIRTASNALQYAGYPEAYFARLSLPQDVVLRLINTIRADDIYGQTAFFPAPEHRTTALASQVMTNDCYPV